MIDTGRAGYQMDMEEAKYQQQNTFLRGFYKITSQSPAEDVHRGSNFAL